MSRRLWVVALVLALSTSPLHAQEGVPAQDVVEPPVEEAVEAESPAATATPAASPAIAPSPTRTPAPALIVQEQSRTVRTNLPQSPDAVSVIGEVRNDSAVRVTWTMSVRLQDSAGNTVAAGTDRSPVFCPATCVTLPMEPGEVQPYSVSIDKAPPFASVEASTRASDYSRAPRPANGPPVRLTNTLAHYAIPDPTPRAALRNGIVPTPLGGLDRYPSLGVRGSVTNTSGGPVAAFVSVWYVNRDGQVVGVTKGINLKPSPLYPNISATYQGSLSRSATDDATKAKWVVWGIPVAE